MNHSPLRANDIPVGTGSLHVIEAGPPTAPPVLLLHGWPQSASAWAPMMAIGSADARLIAVDLPGIGGSAAVTTDGNKASLAGVIRQLIEAMGLTERSQPDLTGTGPSAAMRSRTPARTT